jgi:hypothetical protein
MHMPLLALAHRILATPLSNAGPAQLVLALVEPIVMTVLLVAACLGLHRALRAIHAGWLFELPTTPPTTRRPSTMADAVAATR